LKDIEYRRYQLVLGKNGVQPIEENGKKTDKFSAPVTEKALPKLYAVKANAEVLYVGFTVQSISNRLRGGFQADGTHGYHGYKWKDLSKVELFVWWFRELSSRQVESIEAEVVYLIRNETGNWPKCQNEIHFWPTSEHDRNLARTIFDQLFRVAS
jgi:hypothetical protein